MSAAPATDHAEVVAITPRGRMTLLAPLGRVANLCGLEFDSDMLSGGGARLVTDPDQMMQDGPPSGPPAWPERYGRDGKRRKESK